MKLKVLNLLLEAHRRNLIHGKDDVNKNKPLGERWLGLGTEPNYREAIADGYMKFVSYPSFKCMGWLHLTPKGEEIIHKFEALGIVLEDFNSFDFIARQKIGDYRKL